MYNICSLLIVCVKPHANCLPIAQQGRTALCSRACRESASSACSAGACSSGHLIGPHVAPCYHKIRLLIVLAGCTGPGAGVRLTASTTLRWSPSMSRVLRHQGWCAPSITDSASRACGFSSSAGCLPCRFQSMVGSCTNVSSTLTIVSQCARSTCRDYCQ